MASNPPCCVCGRPGTRRLGDRWFCDEDYARATRHNPGLVRTVAALVAGLVVFSVLIWLIAQTGAFREMPRPVLFLLGLILALVPAIAWLWFFYSQDRLEPEPRSYVIAVFFLGALLTDFFARRVFDAYELDRWLPMSNAALLLGSILVRGFVYSLITWAVVRYTVYPTSEFDERMDGIVYGTAAGLGIATMHNLNYVIGSGGVLLGPGVINIVVTTLAQASFAGIIGYFLGEAKFVHEAAWWMPLGILVASVLNGIFLALSVTVRATAGTSVNVIAALILAAVVAILVFGALIWLMRRATAETLAAQAAQ